jgi:hypothetical protein
MDCQQTQKIILRYESGASEKRFNFLYRPPAEFVEKADRFKNLDRRAQTLSVPVRFAARLRHG